MKRRAIEDLLPGIVENISCRGETMSESARPLDVMLSKAKHLAF
jgi:hypothetical protein